MGEWEQILQWLEQMATGAPAGAPVAGPPSPSNQGFMAGPGQPGGVGTPATGGTGLNTLLNLLLGGTGAYYGSDELRLMQRLYGEQANAAGIAMNPAEMAARANQATAPLNKKLVYGVTQPVKEQLALSGMSQAPGASASAIASALAPYEQQNQQTGAQLAEFGFPYVFSQQAPNYLSILSQLGALGQSQTNPSGAPAATGGGTGGFNIPPYLLSSLLTSGAGLPGVH